jgi:hypothetical protein
MRIGFGFEMSVRSAQRETGQTVHDWGCPVTNLPGKLSYSRVAHTQLRKAMLVLQGRVQCDLATLSGESRWDRRKRLAAQERQRRPRPSAS